jgi:hypothetical protein
VREYCFFPLFATIYPIEFYITQSENYVWVRPQKNQSNCKKMDEKTQQKQIEMEIVTA